MNTRAGGVPRVIPGYNRHTVTKPIAIGVLGVTKGVTFDDGGALVVLARSAGSALAITEQTGGLVVGRGRASVRVVVERENGPIPWSSIGRAGSSLLPHQARSRLVEAVEGG